MEKTLKSWMFEKQIGDQAMADAIGITRSYLNAIKNGKPAGRKLAPIISAYTNNEVPVDTLLYPPK